MRALPLSARLLCLVIAVSLLLAGRGPEASDGPKRTITSVVELGQQASYISHIRIERVLTVYQERPLEDKQRVVVYGAHVIDWLKDPGRGRPNPPMMKLQWRIDKTEDGLSFPPLRSAQELIICTDTGPRWEYGAGKPRIVGFVGEHRPALAPPYGVIRVEGGYTCPFYTRLNDDDSEFRYPCQRQMKNPHFAS